MSTKYHEIRDHLWDVNRQSLKKGLRELKMQDPRRADFTRHDILDVDFDGVELLLKLKDGRVWQGVAEDLRPHEQLIVGDWAIVKATDADLGLSGSDGGKMKLVIFSGEIEPSFNEPIFWSKDNGWGPLHQATVFSSREAEEMGGDFPENPHGGKPNWVILPGS